ncbi:MAG: DNA-protecting protein DprA [Eubacterium sp.]|jgi:DNA processing protein|nr:DNA-protecting protein DprA [Eubacterium sp.]
MEDKRKYQYWMKCIPGIGNKKLRKLVEYCGSAQEVYGLGEQELKNVEGLRSCDVQAILESRERFDPEKEARVLEETGVSMITLEEEEFPERLRHLADCPYALFYKGDLPKEEEKTAAVVGARMCSSYGRAAALELGEKLAACHVSVVSGMAFGIDSFGHWGALGGGGKTYAVLGCGADVCYPGGGRELYEKIWKNGGILSEYPPHTRPAAAQFPARNRLISALSDVVIVVEARKKSGSLITADFALEQGKDIYAVPGRMDDVQSAGCNELIRQGSGIITSCESLLEELGLAADKSEGKENFIKNLLEKEEALVYSCFDLQPKNMEELLKEVKIPAAAMADLLVRLQTKGLIEEYFKNHYRKK